MVILFDKFHLPESIYEVIFSTEQQAIVAKMLINQIKKNKGQLNKTEMSMFAKQLHDGMKIEQEEKQGFQIKKKNITISYNKRQFYDRILTPMRTMGLIDYDMYSKAYSISKEFNKELQKIGIMWSRELEKHPDKK